MEKHFVVFYSPGTFFNETSTKEISSWDVEKAKEMALDISERYGATPYAFSFETVTRTGEGWEMKETVKESKGRYFLGGKIETLAEVEARNDPKEKILLSNMKCNGWDKIITNTNSWKITQPFTKDDTLLEFTPQKKDVNS